MEIPKNKSDKLEKADNRQVVSVPAQEHKPLKQERHVVFTLNNFLAFLGLVVTLIGGAFYFGDRMGANKFDTQKIDMHDSIITLNQKIEKVNAHFADYKDSLEDAEMIEQIDNAVTHDLHPIPAWEKFKNKLQNKRHG